MRFLDTLTVEVSRRGHEDGFTELFCGLLLTNLKRCAQSFIPAREFSFEIHRLRIHVLGVRVTGIHVMRVHAMGIHELGFDAMEVRAMGIHVLGFHVMRIHEMVFSLCAFTLW